MLFIWTRWTLGTGLGICFSENFGRIRWAFSSVLRIYYPDAFIWTRWTFGTVLYLHFSSVRFWFSPLTWIIFRPVSFFIPALVGQGEVLWRSILNGRADNVFNVYPQVQFLQPCCTTQLHYILVCCFAGDNWELFYGYTKRRRPEPCLYPTIPWIWKLAYQTTSQ